MKVVEQFLEEATRERFGFLYVNMLAPSREEAFFKQEKMWFVGLEKTFRGIVSH